MVLSHIPNLSGSYVKEIKDCYSSFLTDVLCGCFLLGVMHSRVYELKFAKCTVKDSPSFVA